jgi:hypothetical protein
MFSIFFCNLTLKTSIIFLGVSNYNNKKLTKSCTVCIKIGFAECLVFSEQIFKIFTCQLLIVFSCMQNILLRFQITATRLAESFTQNTLSQNHWHQNKNKS